MTRNLKSIVQRIGRISRNSGNLEKNYHYVFDKNLKIEKVDFLIKASVHLACCNYNALDIDSLLKSKIKVNAETQNIDTTLQEEIEFILGRSGLKKYKVVNFYGQVSKNPDDYMPWEELIKWVRKNSKRVLSYIGKRESLKRNLKKLAWERAFDDGFLPEGAPRDPTIYREWEEQ
jgi:hypothetical protein